MSEYNIEVEGGKSVRLPTAGKYCDRDIVVTATGSGGSGSGDYDAGYLAGQQSEYDRFWGICQNYGKRTGYYYGFAYTSWADGYFNPKYTITCKGGSSGQAVFYNNTGITAIPCNIEVIGATARNMFYGCANLKTIKKLELEGATDFTGAFTKCDALEEIEIGGSIDVNFNISATAVLSDASVQSIIDHLKDLTGQAQQTLTFHNVVGEKLTDEQRAAITAKNWNLVY